ncbi:MAG TPA: DNA methyltransferase [Gaiellales bacterium]|nr:DNA methyltransferase [Gaiellales bacterium]
MAGRTQAELYAHIDSELSWSEADLPERERTKHVHRLHPYLGKYPPQLVEVLLRRRFAPGALIYDPFAGSGTTLVEASVLGMHAVGCDVSAFNCLLCQVKSSPPDVHGAEAELARALALPPSDEPATPWLERWYAPRALAELAGFRGALEGSPQRPVLSVVLSRAARSARRVPHFALDEAREPVLEPYWCHKHRRTCKPVEEAARFLRRYAADTVRRLATYGAIRKDVDVAVLHADARDAELPDGIDGVITSPPYPGLIDYHEQHRYAYELLGLEDRRSLELGAAAHGTTRRAVAAYCDGIVAVLQHTRRHLARDACVAIVVNDRRGLYDDIARRAGLRLESRTARHVNRRTGRRAGEYFEDVLWLRPARRPTAAAAR